ncbi:hypothetical protein CLV62_101477 [Dysgonomonas alginatilytica]|uniref:Uncharacterized protein n=1 Tax=Dysgonomonas alginatilytica TaxID=1605892 RepID=A0A2V3PX89_9BACT|nr:hypothetical protein [Dysgonomonas alginatilytica]PXV69208.1 hypothetical protein CLV62_101477 [Dysgonomonas alginatilytica]
MSSTTIIPECYVDTNLIETLVPPKDGKGYNHKKGCPAVAKVMIEKFADRFALGIMDKDKKTVKYLEEFDLIVNTNSLYLHKHKTRHHYIILINPATERFVLNSAKELSISLSQFGLPDNLEELKQITKPETSKNNANLKSAFRALKDAPDFMILKSWVKYMRDNTFSTDTEELKKIATSNK